jgi:hypothetical protein
MGGVGGKERIDIIQWFISKGSQIKESEPARFGYFYDEPVSQVQLQGGRLSLFTMHMYTSEEDDAPMHPDLGTSICSQRGSRLDGCASVSLTVPPGRSKMQVLRQAPSGFQQYSKAGVAEREGTRPSVVL